MLANIEVVPNGFSALDFIDWWRPLLNDQKYDMAEYELKEALNLEPENKLILMSYARLLKMICCYAMESISRETCLSSYMGNQVTRN